MPRPHQQQCPSNIVECYKLNDSFDNVECCFDIVAVCGNKVEYGFDKVERSFDNVACCFGIVAVVDGALRVPVADVMERRNLRSATRGLLNFPRYNMTSYGRRAFSYAGPHAWNSLPERLRRTTSIELFKRSLKTFLFEQIAR